MTIAELRHPHLVVMNIADDGTGFEPELEGGRLLSELQQAVGGSLPLSVSLRILLDAMSGLAALHGARADGTPLDFVHGEFTPANIVVGKDGVGRLVPLVQAHWSPGTAPLEAIAYSAPEKLLGDDFNQRADVFSAGVLLWEAMMGRPLFHGLSVNDVVMRVVGGKVARPAVAGEAAWADELSDVVMRALAADPADRWQQVGIMGADIETIGEGQMARSSDVASLVTGRHVSRDSLSDEITMPLASRPSLSPYANSIPAEGDADHDATTGIRPRRVSSTVPVVGTTTVPGVLRSSMTTRQRRAVVGSALAFSFLLLIVAGYRGLARDSASTSTSTVLAPAPMATIAVASPASPREPAKVADLEPSPIASAPAEPPAIHDSKAARPSGKTSASPGRAKPKEDPFGLMHPAVRPKPKDDPFGL